MANIQFGVAIAAARGAVGGVVFSRGAGGAIMRNRSRPINPRSSLQKLRRTQVAYITKYWSETCTEQERIDWRAYAAGTSWTNKLGQSIQINGLAAFLRLNAHMAIYGSTFRHAAPTAMGHAGGVTFTFLAESDTRKIQCAEPTGSFDKSILGHWLNLYQGLPMQPGRLTTPTGFRYIGSLYGHDSAPMTFPFEMDSAYLLTEGQLVTIKAKFNDEDYRVSGPHWYSVLAAPSI